MRERTEPTPGQHLILYDGVCGLCNRFNHFVLRADRAGLFCFAALQSRVGREWVQGRHRNAGDPDTLYVIASFRSESRVVLDRSAAALFVLKSLGPPWSWARVVGLLPRPVLDWGYNRLAAMRYRLFGRYDTCPIPSIQHRSRFIDL